MQPEVIEPIDDDRMNAHAVHRAERLLEVLSEFAMKPTETTGDLSPTLAAGVDMVALQLVYNLLFRNQPRDQHARATALANVLVIEVEQAWAQRGRA